MRLRALLILATTLLGVLALGGGGAGRDQDLLR
jgi:hypothetical protein